MTKFQNTGLPDWDWWGRLWPTPAETLRELGITSGTTLADVGSGNGYFTLPAARIADPAPVYALDLDADLLDDLDHLADRQRVDNVESIHGDARSLADHLPEPVDLVLLANAFHGVDDAAGLVRAVHRSLSPGGRFVVVNWQDLPREETTVAGDPRGPPTDLRMTPDETEAAVVGADGTAAADAGGFERQRQVDLPPYHYAVVFERK